MKFLQVILSDPIFVFASIVFLVLVIFGPIRRSKIIYGKDGIAYDPSGRRSFVYDLNLYAKAPGRKENMRKILLSKKDSQGSKRETRGDSANVRET